MSLAHMQGILVFPPCCIVSTTTRQQVVLVADLSIIKIKPDSRILCLGRNSQLSTCSVMARNLLTTTVTSRLKGLGTFSSSCRTCRQNPRTFFRLLCCKEKEPIHSAAPHIIVSRVHPVTVEPFAFQWYKATKAHRDQPSEELNHCCNS